MTTDPDPSAGETPARPARRRHVPRIAAFLLIAALAGGGYLGREAWLGGPGEAAAPADLPPPSVTVGRPLVKEIVEWDEYTGQFAAVESVEIRARVSGYLQSVRFRDGQLVEKGDLLYEIDPRPFEIALESAQARLASAQAAVDLARAQLGRAEALQRNDFVSRAAFDERTQESRAAAADVGIARAAVAAARLDLEYTRIHAPVSGRIGASEVDVGNLVAGGSAGATTLLTTIVSIDPVHLVFDVSESTLLAHQRAIREGRLASPRDGKVGIEARLLDEEGWTMHGTIDFLDNQVDRTTGTIRLRAILPNPDGVILPGQFGEVRIPASERYSAILVPEASVVTDQARKVVLTVDDEGTVVPRQVKAGPNRGPLLRIIRDGLDPDARIVISGILRARPGAKVNAVEGSFDLPDPEE